MQHGKTFLEARLGKVIKEDAAHAALFAAVLVAEILVTPLLEARIQIIAKRRERVAANGVKVHRVFIKAVIRRQIHATAKPAHWLFTGLACGNHAHIHVNGGHIGVAWVKHQRHAHGLERRARQFRPVLRGRWRQLRTLHVREATARALEHAAVFHDLGDAVALQALLGALAPGVLQKACATHVGGPFDGFERLGDPRLQIHEVVAHTAHAVGRIELGGGVVHHECCLTAR
ncbi:hypothetical protein SDC9_123416 [bioreactor metagenome]|uniref:Uncharacterized protein n=1 Tax=bioreactor metagenome TaxID=1076179 RepID=A0A645CHN7_9ZZZZ